MNIWFVLMAMLLVGALGLLFWALSCDSLAHHKRGLNLAKGACGCVVVAAIVLATHLREVTSAGSIPLPSIWGLFTEVVSDTSQISVTSRPASPGTTQPAAERSELP